MTFDLGITRRQRYVSTQTAANVTTSTYAQGGTITSYTYSGTTYIAHIFTVSGIFTVTSDVYPLEFIAVAGGGGGGNNVGTNSGGGGGGGGIITTGVANTINRVYASPLYRAVTTATLANAVGGWDNSPLTDFVGGNGSFQFSWRAIQQTGGGARTAIIPEPSSMYLVSQYYYMEIGITAIGPADVAVGLIRDGQVKDGFANIPYVNLNGGTTGNWSGAAQTALGTFVAGDTLQIAWRSDPANALGTYWHFGRNNTWYSNSFPTNPIASDATNIAITTGTYITHGLRLIFMSAASGGGTLRGQFRSGNENKYAPPIVNGMYINTITNYSGYYTTPVGSNYVSSGTTYGVTIGAGGGVGSYNPSPQIGAPGSNGGDTVIYNATNPSFYYSTYFSNSYVTATNAAFAFGTGDFTIETWVYPTSSYGKQTTIYNHRPIFNSRNFVQPDTANRGFIVYLNYANKVTLYTSGTTYITTINTVSNAAWSHLAVSRTDNIINVWINGVKDQITSISTSSQNFINQNIMIGYGSQNQDLSQNMFFTGYFSNYRIVKGLSVYNPGFQGLTVPVAATQSANVKGTPSAAIAGTLTSLLMLTTSTTGIFYDSSLGNTSTIYGITTNTGYASGLGPGTYSGSILLNNSLQSVLYSTSTSRAFTFGSDDFTVEYWAYYISTNGTYQQAVGNATTINGYAFGLNTNYLYMTTSAVGYPANSAIIRTQQWLHIAWARKGTDINVYINGSWVWTFNNMTTNVTETGFGIGGRTTFSVWPPSTSFNMYGYLSNIRVVKGVALYTNTGNFTTPTTISSATQSASTDFIINAITTQTVLLTFNTATIVDRSTLSNVLTQISGTVTISTFAPFTTSTIMARAFGGGGGGSTYRNDGQVGGSGGGAPGQGGPGSGIPAQGNQGGMGGSSVSLGAGGGGYAYPGGPASGDQSTWPVSVNGQLPAGYGGAGGYFDHSGAMVAYSGGGGGGSWNSASYGVGLGGVGGGGNGAYYNLSSVLISATAGTVNSGGGGGGSNVNFSNAAAGGSGIVIFRYPAFLGNAARFPTDLTDSNLKNTTLLLSSNRAPTALTPVYATTASSNAFTVDYLIVGGGGGGGGASTSTGAGGGGGGAGGVLSAVGYKPPGTYNTMFYADVAYGPADRGGSVQGWTTATDFGNLGTGAWFFNYAGLQFSTSAKTSALSEAGNYYFEIQLTSITGNNANQIGLVRNSISGFAALNNVGIYLLDGNTYIGNGSTNVANGTDTRGAFAVNDVLGIAYNPTTNKQWFSRNGVWLIGNDPAVNAGYDIVGTGPIVLQIVSGSSTSPNNGGIFRRSTQNSYTVPTGFVPYTTGIILTSSTWTITVGSGGSGGTSGLSPTSGSSGTNSSISFSNTNFIAYGGGGGGASYPTSAGGLSGGSGGGGSYNTGGGVISVGQGNVGAPTAAAFSAAGATTSTGYPGGGGGGAGSAGSWTFQSSTGGSGGAGTYTSIISAPTALSAGVGQVVNGLVYFAGGGSGAGTYLSGIGSLYFAGGSNNQRLSLPASSAFDLSGGTWTIEFWMYSTATPSVGNQCRMFMFGVNQTTTGFVVGYNNDGTIVGGLPIAQPYVPTNPTVVASAAGAITLNTWYHVAMVSNASSATIYINGSQSGSTVALTEPTSSSPTLNIGYDTVGTVNFQYKGYLSNIRIVNGSAVYTSNFTRPASPLTNISNTQLLLLSTGDANKILDSSNNNFIITNSGVTYNVLSPIVVVTATNYTGFGGSGAIYGNTSTAGVGGSGIVVIRYPNTQPDATVTPGVATYINTGGYKTYIFTATGNISFASNITYSTSSYITGYISGTAITNNRIIYDSSLNNIIFNTATTTIAQGAFSPYGSLWSTSFNGSTDYISFVSTVTTGTAFQQNVFWGANKSFTIEAWLNPNNNQVSSTATVILGNAQPTGAGLDWSVGLDSFNRPMMYWKDPVNGNNFITATNTLSTGTWNHVAWVSNAGTPTIFINGFNQILTTSTISTLTNTTQTYGIVSGAYFNRFYNGSISNLRVSTSALYFPNLLPSSGYFNGINYLTSATSTAMTFGTNNFTVEFWVYWATVGAVGSGIYNQLIGKIVSANGLGFGAGGGNWYMTTSVDGRNSSIPIATGQWYHVAWVRNSGVVTLYLNGISSYTTAFATNITETGFDIGGSSASASQYANAAISNLRIVKGTAVYTSNFTVPSLDLTNITNTSLLTFLSTSTTFQDYSTTPSTLTAVRSPLLVGFNPQPVVSFTPSTDSLNASRNTILLTNNTYRHFDSSTSSFAISTGTTTSIPRIQRYSPFSMKYAYNPLTIGGSASFNGFSDFLYTTTATDASFISTANSLQLDSDFTIECWIYTTSTAVVQTIFDTAGKDGNALRPNAFSLNISTSGQLFFNYNNSTSTSAVTPISRFTWAHIAVTRYSGIMQLWQNGIQTLAINTNTNYSTGQLVIGRNGTTATSFFAGFISDFRIIKGQVIYNNTFNPPVSPLKIIDTTTATSLLLNFNSAAIVDATMQHNVIVVNSSTISSNVAKYNPRSIYFPGFAEYLTVVPNSTSSYALGANDFTVEMWVYLLPQTGWVGVNTFQPTTVRSIFDMRTQNTANAGFDIFLGNTGTLNVSTVGFSYITGTNLISVNTWHHIALTKRGTSHNLFLNGIPEGNTYVSTATNFINPTVRIGFGAAGVGYFNGYIDDVRITRGFARYSYPGFLVPQKSLPVK